MPFTSDERRPQSAEDRAEIRRRRRLHEEEAMRDRGEHVPTSAERWDRLIVATGQVAASMRALREHLEQEQGTHTGR